MNKYVVKVSSVFSSLIDVEAEDEDMAKVKAKEYLEAKPEAEEGHKEMRHFYESTFPPEHWPVITKEKFDELTKQVEEKISNVKGADDFTAGEETVRNIITPNNFE